MKINDLVQTIKGSARGTVTAINGEICDVLLLGETEPTEFLARELSPLRRPRSKIGHLAATFSSSGATPSTSNSQARFAGVFSTEDLASLERDQERALKAQAARLQKEEVPSPREERVTMFNATRNQVLNARHKAAKIKK
jgi:hypothetical protein